MNNITKIEKAVGRSYYDAVLLTSRENLYYATGYDNAEAYLILTAEEAAYFVDARCSEEAAAKIPDTQVVLIETAAAAYDKMNAFLKARGVKVLGVEEGKLSCSSYRRLEEKLTPELADAQSFMNDMRALKTREELDVLIRAQRIAEQAFRETVAQIRPAMTEQELAAELFCNMIKNGAEDRSFDTIVVSGSHTSMPHGKPEARQLQRGFLTIDFGCKVGGYCSDTTRTLAIGEPTAEMEKVYDTVLQAQLAAIAGAKGGMTGRAIDAIARDVIRDAGYGDYFSHSLSHGVGLEIHEAPYCSPRSTDVIAPGAVISMEPGIYLPGRFGVRIEDVVYVTEEGCEDITALEKGLSVVLA